MHDNRFLLNYGIILKHDARNSLPLLAFLCIYDVRYTTVVRTIFFGSAAFRFINAAFAVVRFFLPGFF